MRDQKMVPRDGDVEDELSKISRCEPDKWVSESILSWGDCTSSKPQSDEGCQIRSILKRAPWGMEE